MRNIEYAACWMRAVAMANAATLAARTVPRRLRTARTTLEGISRVDG